MNFAPLGLPASSRAAMIAALVGTIWTCDSLGLDVGANLASLLALEATDTAGATPATAAALGHFVHPSREEAIDALYARLAEVADSAASDEDARSEYDALFTELRALQSEAAAELSAELATRRSLDPDRLAAVLARADQLLADHEDPTRPS